jgi:hypothetical protein
MRCRLKPIGMRAIDEQPTPGKNRIDAGTDVSGIICRHVQTVAT